MHATDLLGYVKGLSGAGQSVGRVGSGQRLDPEQGPCVEVPDRLEDGREASLIDQPPDRLLLLEGGHEHALPYVIELRGAVASSALGLIQGGIGLGAQGGGLQSRAQAKRFRHVNGRGLSPIALRPAGQEVTPATVLGTEAAIEAKITNLPVTLPIAGGRGSSGQTKFVMGLRQASVTDAPNPSSTMSGASSYSAAQSALGEGIPPSVTVALGSLANLLEHVGLARPGIAARRLSLRPAPARGSPSR